jgi:hypothetical protein
MQAILLPLTLTLALLAATPMAVVAQNQKDAAAPAKPAPMRDASALQSQALLGAIDKILRRAAAEREAAKTLPERDKFFIPPIFSETREEREIAVRELLDSALAIVTDAPVLQKQAEIKRYRDTIASLKERKAEYREKRLEAPQAGVMPSIFTETQESIDRAVTRIDEDIKAREADIARLKGEIRDALAAAGVSLSPEQVDLLLDSVLGGHLLKLVTAFEVAKVADKRLATLVNQSNEDLKAARRYFAMHAALFAMLVHAQELMIEQIDKVYLAKLDTIVMDIAKSRQTTRELIATATRDDQRKTLEANLKSQELSDRVARFYRDYLQTQRRMLADARQKMLLDLRIADNTYSTVEASFQLRTLMDEARTSFEALQRLEAPGFEQIFKNDNLRREFENLTQKLAPSS